MGYDRTVIIVTITLLVLVLTPQLSMADDIWTCDSNGNPKREYYDNETVYVTSNDITDGTSQSIRLYIINDNNDWDDGDVLEDDSSGYMVINTNSSGQINSTDYIGYPRWDNPEIGSYDIVADIDKDGIYNESGDFINSLTSSGFNITESPKPKLILEIGSETPGNGQVNISDSMKKTMIQFNATSGAVEDVKIYSMTLRASGTGNESSDVKYAGLIHDANNNGIGEENETMVGYCEYTRDDGLCSFELEDGFKIDKNTSTSFTIIYEFKDGENGKDFKFDIAIVSARGADSNEDAIIEGTPIGSSIQTIEKSSESITTPLVDECQEDEDCGGTKCLDKKKEVFTCEYDSSRGINLCTSSIEYVECCTAEDCVSGYYCSDYECKKEGMSFSISSIFKNRITTLLSTIVVFGIAGAAFLFIKNRGDKKWLKKSRARDDWERLREKWKESNKKAQNKD